MGRHKIRGNRGANLGKIYWTKRRERVYQADVAQRERDEIEGRAARLAAAKERGRIRSRLYARKKRAERVAAGLPANPPHPEPAGASTARRRRFDERQRVKKAAEAAAALVAAEVSRKERNRARQAVCRANRKKRAADKVIAMQDYLISQWWSPEIRESAAKQIITSQYSHWDALQLDSAFAHLEACAHHLNLNVNRFTIAQDGIDGLSLAEEQRAILFELQRTTGRTDLSVLVKEAAEIKLRDMEKFKSLENESRVANAIIKAKSHAQSLLKNGDLIFVAVSGKDDQIADANSTSFDVHTYSAHRLAWESVQGT